jgi:lipoprotein signal peptidase
VNRAPFIGAGLAAVVIALDQATKISMLGRFGDDLPPKPLAPFLDLNLKLNPGVSFSFFAQQSKLGVDLLIAFNLAVTAGLIVWLIRSQSWLVALGIGAIIGGAVGNVADRFFYGAVVDFLDLHAFGRHFFVFNLADAAINVGVALLLIEAVWGRSAPKEHGAGAGDRAKGLGG